MTMTSGGGSIVTTCFGRDRPTTLHLTAIMLRWRVLSFVLLLILSLPVLSVAEAATLRGASSAVMGPVSVSGDALHGAASLHAVAGQPIDAATVDRACDPPGDATMKHAHAPGQCGMCALCYSAGAGAPDSNAVLPRHRLLVLHVFHPTSDAATRFLTGGIERPPRVFLA